MPGAYRSTAGYFVLSFHSLFRGTHLYKYFTIANVVRCFSWGLSFAFLLQKKSPINYTAMYIKILAASGQQGPARKFI